MRSLFALACLTLAASLGIDSTAVLAQPVEQQARVAASFVLALGRTPTAGELDQWVGQGSLPISDLVSRHRRNLQADPAARRAVVQKAAIDAFGREPAAGDVEAARADAIYVDLVQQHLAWLADHPAEYEQVAHRAYRLLLERDAYAVEIEYWKRQPPLSFALLVACVEDWARRNRPGLMATAGTAAASVNSEYLAAVRLSPAVAAEARLAAGLEPLARRAEEAALSTAAGRHVVAPGANSVVSVGGVHFVAAGSARLAPAAGR
jgi:hypothetical protein